jgi:hypothetical protein
MYLRPLTSLLPSSFKVLVKLPLCLLARVHNGNTACTTRIPSLDFADSMGYLGFTWEES